MEINLLLILSIVLFIYFLKESKNKVLRKALGSFLIIFGLYIAIPFPGLDDLLLYPLFSSFMNWELSLESIKNNLLPYTLITTGVGLGMAWIGIYISNLKPKYLINKIKRVFK